VSIADAPARQRIAICGQVVRMRALPSSGLPSLAVTVSDQSGRAVAIWSGRRAIGGISLGRTLLLEGVATRVGGHLQLTNPAYELLPDR
jgi:hypothetical protein